MRFLGRKQDGLVSSERLIVFTRYPQPGKTKTRLIPALGAEGAAQLQRAMTEYTLAQAALLSDAVSVEVWFAGGDRQLMQTWLGSQLAYHPQPDGDLGYRMQEAFEVAFAAGYERVITIGIDCPELSSAVMQRALDVLQSHDLVLGPATDGGYYLIGLSRFIPDLFVGVDWGTVAVLSQTVAIAQRLGLAIAYLDPLTDVDCPEDLVVWERQQLQALSSSVPKISVIIPVLNEADLIAETLMRLLEQPGLELIVVDGGSQDETVAIAQSLGVTVLQSAPGRAVQMNVGAQAATGKILLFLHVDTCLPSNFERLVEQTLTQPNVVAGAFELAIASNLPGLRWVEWGVKWRSRLLQLPYGDQAIFLTAKMFDQIGGFPELPIMEDFELIRQLQKQGQIAIAPASVVTSGRRWEKLGTLRTTMINQLVVLGYFLGVSPNRIRQWYGIKDHDLQQFSDE
jgi:hypothetical protein